MLRITRTKREDATTYRLEGKLLGPWVNELAAMVAETTPPKVELDLLNVAFVDYAGANLLRSLIADGATVSGCSDFVAAMLEVHRK